MILLGCLLAFGLAVAPRLFLILAWIFSARWPFVWQGDFLIPLLGIIFLPYTTIMYMLVWSPTGIDGWDWLWIALGVLLDFWKWQQVIQNRKQAMETGTQYYSSTRSGSSASGSVSSMAAAAPLAASATAAAAPVTASPPAAAAGAGEEEVDTAADAVEGEASSDESSSTG